MSQNASVALRVAGNFLWVWSEAAIVGFLRDGQPRPKPLTLLRCRPFESVAPLQGQFHQGHCRPWAALLAPRLGRPCRHSTSQRRRVLQPPALTRQVLLYLSSSYPTSLLASIAFTRFPKQGHPRQLFWFLQPFMVILSEVCLVGEFDQSSRNRSLSRER